MVKRGNKEGSSPDPPQHPRWQNYLSPYKGVFKMRIDHETRTIWLIPIAGMLFFTPAPIKIKGKLYKYAIAEPDMEIPQKFKPFYERRNEPHSLDTLVRCFLPMLWLNYRSMNTFLPVRGEFERNGENSLTECIPSLKAEAEYAIAVGKLRVSKKKKPYRVTPANFVHWLIESKYEFIGEHWVKPFLMMWINDTKSGKSHRRPKVTPEKERYYITILAAWDKYKAKFGRKALRKDFCRELKSVDGKIITAIDLERAFDWRRQRNKRATTPTDKT